MKINQAQESTPEGRSLIFILIALRSLLRNKRRSVLTGAAIFTGAFMLTFGSAYGNGIEKQLISTTVAGETGHISITARVSKRTEQEELITNITKWKEQLIGNTGDIQKRLTVYPGVRQVAERVKINGMVSNGEKLDSIFLIAVEPEKEKDLFLRVVPVERGKVLTPQGEFPEIYISRTVAQNFKVDIGDTLTIMAQTAGGSANTMDVTVIGTFKKGALWRENYAYLRLPDARRLAQIGNGVTQFKLMVDDESHSKLIAAHLRKDLGKYRLSIKDWESAAGLFLGVVLFNRMAVDVLCFVLFVVSMASIVNTMLMAVHERTREIGTLMAMGAKRREIAYLFILEAGLLSGMTAGAGVILAGLLSLRLSRTGIPAFNEMMSYMYGSSRTFPCLSLKDAAGIFVLVVVLTTAVAVYPAISASRLRPVEALAPNQ